MTNKNPYIIGIPIPKEDNFFGREELFLFIEDSLSADTKFLLLHGQRRIGKSSVLKQLAHKVDQKEFVFVIFDLQIHSDSSLSDILYNLAETIAEDLKIDSDMIALPSDENLNTNPDIFFDNFLLEVYQQLDGKKLVLLLDEFDVVSSDNSILSQGESFFRYLQSLLKKQSKLFIIPVVGRAKDDFENLFQLFKSPPYQEIGLLNDLSARRLITRPVQGRLEYNEDAIQAILKLSAGHPFFTQAICFNLFEQAKIEDNWTVTGSDVQSIVDRAIESAESGLSWFWDGLSISEQVVFSAVAEAHKIAIEQNKSIPEDPLTRLRKYGVIPTQLLTHAAKQLANKGYLDDTEHRVKIELVRRWLVKYHKLNQEILKLQEINKEEINKIKETADGQDNNQDGIDHYEEILKLNPNYFIILPDLAQKYLEIENFDKALELHTRAYKVNPIVNKEGLLLAQETYGKKLIEQGELIKAKVQFEGVLEIESDRESATQELRRIETKLENQQLTTVTVQDHSVQRRRNYLITANPQRVILGIIATVIAVVGGGIGIYQFLTPCSGGQQKLNGSCPSIATNTPTPTPTLGNIESKISRGDRTLFSDTPNTFRDQGIEAFKKGNYPQAIKLFETALKTDKRKDPEVLIYYNNAKAREKGNPLTLAVVVPEDKSIAPEMLRGVAQAQNKFNVNDGLNGRLLEIVIANDDDKPDQAKQIAQKLVRDESVLGVIGHYSSKTTESALDVYKLESIPIISPTSTANSLSDKVFFRTAPSDVASGKILAEYAKNFPLNKVTIAYNPKSPYSNSLKEEFEKNFGQSDRNIDLTDPRLNTTQELKDSATQQVQAVMLLPANENDINAALKIAKVNADNKLELKLLGGDTLYDLITLQNDGIAVKGLVLAVPWFREAPQAQKFAVPAEKYWGGGISWRTATSFDATQAFIKSLSSNPSRESILQGLRSIKLPPEETSGNELKFINGERQSKPILVKVEKGQFKCLQQLCSP